jgi:hypothetical protein
VPSTPFHTATYNHHVPGARVEMSAVSYNLQYTKPLVDEFVAQNPPGSTELDPVWIGDQELVRANFYGKDPGDATRRICVIGVGDEEDRATQAADSAWFEDHASVLFFNHAGDGPTHSVSIQRPVPGVPAQRATTVGVLYNLGYMRPFVEAAVSRNAPTHDEVQVVECGEITLMRVDLYGRHPLESNRPVCVGGIADRHFRGVSAAEHAWANYHTSLLFGAQALGSP